MNNIQILTIVLALATSYIAMLTGVLLNNNRLNDVKEGLKALIDGKSSTAEVMELRLLIEKNHSELLLKFAEMDNRLNLVDARLSRIEGERRIVQ